MDRSEGARRLEAWLDSKASSGAAFAEVVGVSRVTVHHWLHGRIRPRGTPVVPGTETMREVIARETAGAVPADAWDQPSEGSDIGAYGPDAPLAPEAAPA